MGKGKEIDGKGDIYMRSESGSFTSVQYVQGGWITVPSASDMSSIYA